MYVIEDCKDIQRVLDNIQDASVRSKIKRSISSCGLNTGLTISKKRHSILIIGRSSSLAQFLNTLVHELFHLSVHISNHYDIDLNTEKPAYLIGELIHLIFSPLKKFIINKYTHE